MCVFLPSLVPRLLNRVRVCVSGLDFMVDDALGVHLLEVSACVSVYARVCVGEYVCASLCV